MLSKVQAEPWRSATRPPRCAYLGWGGDVVVATVELHQTHHLGQAAQTFHAFQGYCKAVGHACRRWVDWLGIEADLHGRQAIAGKRAPGVRPCDAYEPVANKPHQPYVDQNPQKLPQPDLSRPIRTIVRTFSSTSALCLPHLARFFLHLGLLYRVFLYV